MGNQTPGEVLPIIPHFGRARARDHDSEGVKNLPTSNEYTIIRLLLNLEKIKELLSLKDVIQSPLGSPQNKNLKCFAILKQMVELHVKSSGATVTHDHKLLSEMGSEIQRILKAGSERVKTTPDDFIRVLTLVHFATNTLSLAREAATPNSKAPEVVIKDLLRSSYNSLSSFDKEAICVHLFNDLAAIRGADKSLAMERRYEFVQSFFQSENTSFIEDISKVQNFYHGVVKRILFSSGSYSPESEIESVANHYRASLLQNLRTKDYDLQLASPLIMNLDFLSAKYFGLAHNCSIAVLTASQKVSVETRQLLVDISFDKNEIYSARMTFIANVSLKNSQGFIIDNTDVSKLRSTVGDLVAKVAELNTSRDYLNDFGFALVTERNGQIDYTTNKANFLADLVSDNFSKVSIVFLPVNQMNLYNNPESSGVKIIAIKSGSSDAMTHTALYAIEGTQTLQNVIDLTNGWINKPGTVGWPTYKCTNHNLRSEVFETSTTSLSIAELSTKVNSRSSAESEDPRPVSIVVSSPKFMDYTNKECWSKYHTSKMNVKLDLGRVISLLTKYSVDWKQQRDQLGHEDIIRIMLPSLLVIPLNLIGKFIEVPRKLGLEFLKEQTRARDIQIPTEYNLVALQASVPGGFDYDIYRKSLTNQEMYSFYEFESNENDIREENTLTVNNQDVIQKEAQLESINMNRVKYAIYQQSLSSN